MTNIKNNAIIQAIRNATLLDDYEDKIPHKLAETLQLILDVTPQQNENNDIVRGADGAAGNTALYTTPTNRNFYLTSIALSGDNDDVVNDSICSIDFVAEDGTASGNAQRFVCRIAASGDGIITNLGTNNSLSLTFAKKGILVKKGSVINLNQSCSHSFGTIVGYTEDETIYNNN